MEKVKTKLEIMDAVNKIKLTQISDGEKIARIIADKAIKEYRNDLMEDLENQLGLKRIIQDAIVSGMHEWTKDMIDGY